MTHQSQSPVIFSGKLAIIVGGSDCDLQHLKQWVDHTGADVFAADGGVHHCLKAGLDIVAVIGDMDSASADVRDSLGQDTDWVEVSEQETTDLEKLLMRLKYHSVLGFGFLDRRFDHALAALSVLVRYAPSHNIILVGGDDVLHVTNRSVHLKIPSGSRLSVWPLSEVCFESSQGLVWPVDGMVMHPEGQVGTSNRTCQDRVSLIPSRASDGYFAVMAAHQHLPAFIDAFHRDSAG